MYVTYDIDTRCVVRIDDNLITVDDDNLDIIECDITFDDDVCINMDIYKVNDECEFYIDDELVQQRNLNTLRGLREPLLRAFDIYKSNLIVGAISLPEEEKKAVITWYNLILNLDEESIKNPPTAISKYIQN